MANIWYRAEGGTSCEVWAHGYNFPGAVGPVDLPESAKGQHLICNWNDAFPQYAVPNPSWCPKLPPKAPAPPDVPQNPPQEGEADPPTTPPAPAPAPGPSPAPAPSPGTGPGPGIGIGGNAPPPPSGRITGPTPPPPPDGCWQPAPSYPNPITPPERLFRGGGGGGYGYSQIDQMAQPLVAGLTPFSVLDESGDPEVEQPLRADVFPHGEPGEKDSGHVTNVFHEATGPGGLCLHPPELQDYMLHGSGVNPGSRWPTAVTPVGFILLNSARVDASTGSSARTVLGFGRLLKGTHKPGYGIYFDFDPATRILNIQHTDADGADESVADGVEIDGVAVGGSAETRPKQDDCALDANATALDASAVEPLGTLLVTSDDNTNEVQGIAAPALTGYAATETVRLRLINVGTDNFTVMHDHASAASGDEIFSAIGDITVVAGDNVDLEYNRTAGHWRVV